MRFNALLTLTALASAIQGMVIVNLFDLNAQVASLLPTSPSGLGEYKSTSPHGDERARIQQVSTKVFRNQPMAVKHAKQRDGYFVADWNAKTVNWVGLGGGDLPDGELLVAGELFSVKLNISDIV